MYRRPFSILKLVLVFCLIVPAIEYTMGQNNPIEQASNTLPPPPTASELGKYGLVPVGMSTGTPNIDIPLYTYNAKGISVPISFSYNSNGIKVDQLASWVGMGWSLNAGGVITRTIRDEADEDNFDELPYPDDFNISEPQTVEYIEQAGENEAFDSEIDLYSFNFLGQSGKFVFDRNGAPIVMPYQNIKIERYFDGTTGYFVITTTDGVKYTFGAVEVTRTFNAGVGCGKNYDGERETSWFLTKIENPTGDVVNFEYSSNTGYTYKASVSQVMMKKLMETECSAGTNCPTFDNQTCVTILRVNGVALSRIWSPNQGEVAFVATKTRTDLDDYKLDEIQIKDEFGNTLRKVAFGYTFSNTLAAYNNEVTTNDLTHRMFLTSVTEKDSNSADVRKHQFEYNDMNGMPPRLAFAQDHWGYFNGIDNNYFVPAYPDAINSSGQQLFPNVNSSREPNWLFASKGILTKIIYPTGGFTQLTYEANTYWASQTGNIETGGGRISKVLKHDPINNKNEETNYFYSKVSDLNGTAKSTGKIGNNPIYYNTSTIQQQCGSSLCSTYNCIYGSLYSSSQNSIYPVGGNNVFYEYVTVINGPDYSNGAEEHQFTVSFDYPGQVIWGEDIISASRSNFSWSNGLEAAVRTFQYKSNAFLIAKETLNNYLQDTRYDNSANSLVIRKKYSPICQTQAIIQCTASNVTKVYKQFRCTASHNHSWLLGGYPFGNNRGQTRCVALGSDNKWVTYATHICYGDPIGSTEIDLRSIDHLDAVEYKNIAYWFYLNSQTEKVYDDNEVVLTSTVKEFFYDNPEHAQVSRSRTIGSDGLVTEVSTWYPQDYAQPGNIQALKDNNILGVPIKIEKTFNTYQVEGSVIQYTDLGQPKDVYSFASNLLLSPVPHDTTVLIPSMNYEWMGTMNYSTSNNLKEVLNAKSPAISFLWDYHDSKPVAKAINAMSDQIAFTSFETTDYGQWNLVSEIQSQSSNFNLNMTSYTVSFQTNISQTVNYSYTMTKTPGPSPELHFINMDGGQGYIKTLSSPSANDSQVLPAGNWNAVLVWESNVSAISVSMPVTTYIQGQPAYSTDARCGQKSFNFQSLIRLEKLLPNTGRYVLSYASKNSSVSINLTNATLINTTQYDIGNGWQLKTAEVEATQPNALARLNGSGVIDDLRLHPSASQMTTYTYEPGIGITSTTDANNVSAFYEYDSFGRLALIKDDKGNILKKFDYHYKNQTTQQ